MLAAEHHLSAAIKSILRKCGMEGVQPGREWLAPAPSSVGFAVLYKDSESHLSLASPVVTLLVDRSRVVRGEHCERRNHSEKRCNGRAFLAPVTEDRR